MKTAEELGHIYNRNYSQTKDVWSLTNHRHADKIANYLCKSIKRNGFETKGQMTFLDVGCAKGHITEAFRKKGFESYGLDCSDVAIEIAKQKFPKCNFIHADGFNPDLNEKFDLILSRGFSGLNTHDLDFVAEFSNKYVNLLNPNSFYVIGTSSDFSGNDGKTWAYWTYDEINNLGEKINAIKIGIIYGYQISIINRIKHAARSILNPKDRKRKYFYILYRK